MNTYLKRTSFLIILFVLLTGCMYPKKELSQNQVPNETQLEMIQNAVEKYQEQTNGLLPIKTKPSDTPTFEKYLIDFSLLKEQGILQEIPGNAFERGGYYQYVIITPEEDPRVKLIDLRMTEALRSITVKLDIYRSKNLYPPFGKEVAKNLFQIDYKKLKLKSAPHVTSPYSQENLPIIMNVDGEVFIDYRIDINKALEEFNHNYQPGEDIRMIIAENTPFVPAYSLPYTLEDNNIIFKNE